MKWEWQFCNRELAQKLKKLGVKQESLFWYLELHWGPEKRFEPYYVLNCGYHKDVEVQFSAFSVAELAERLVAENHHFLPSYNSNFDHGWYYKFFQGPTIHEQTLADCMAGMLVHLTENKIALEI